MKISLYPSLGNTPDLQEVVDHNNIPLCIMRGEDILRQNLRHRAVGLLVRDRLGRALLTFRPGHGWGFSSFGRLPAGQSSEHKAQELFNSDWNHEGRILPLGVSPPGPDNFNAFVALYEGRMPASLAATAVRDPDQHMLVDYDELRGLGVHFGELLSPFLRQAVQSGLVRPR